MIGIGRAHDPERNAAVYVSGELSRQAAHLFEAHLLECDDCWREVSLGLAGKLLAEDALEPAPTGFRDRLRALVRLSGTSLTD